MSLQTLLKAIHEKNMDTARENYGVPSKLVIYIDIGFYYKVCQELPASYLQDPDGLPSGELEGCLIYAVRLVGTNAVEHPPFRVVQVEEEG